jgi:protein gp37
MAINSDIEWTQSTWNPVTGCSKISMGCQHCYAETMARRLHAMGQPNYANGFEVTLHPEMLAKPLEWKKSQTIFVNSMSDLFHEEVPEAFIQKVFETMKQAHWHRFQVLTKRAERLAELAPSLPWPDNVWVGVTVEHSRFQSRIDHLRQVPAAIRFISMEPLLGPLEQLDLSGIHWVIVGGESGPGARPMHPAWVDSIQRQCNAAQVPFFFKQWGGVHKKKAGRSLHGQEWNGMPKAALAM